MMTKERIFDVLRQLQRQCGVPPDDLEAAAHTDAVYSGNGGFGSTL